MSKRKQFRRLSGRASCAAAACAAAALVLAAVSYFGADAAARMSPVRLSASRRQGERVDIRLRSLATRATGQLTVEAGEAGGRARLTAMNLPDPQTVAAGARTYVVWAVSGRRILRLGELRRDDRGNGGLAFDSPSGFERYGVIVTAEAGATPERPGDPVLTTRADEAAALYPVRQPGAEANTSAGASNVNAGAGSAGTGSAGAAAGGTTESAAGAATGGTTRGTSDTTRSTGGAAARPAAARAPAPPAVPALSRTRRVAGDFYAEVDDALISQGGGRVIDLEGDSAAPQARGAARATLRQSRAYVRANFRGVPLPSTVGASVYLLWGIIPDGRIVYMGSLPASEDINRAEVYVRVAGFETDDYTLFVTAERQRPSAEPSGRRLLKPKDSASVK